MASKYTLFEIVITAIIVREGKYLITQRSPEKKRFGGMWTVPGGHLEPSDYLELPKDTEHYWYNVLEKALAREIREETGLEVDNVFYLTSLATVHGDGAPSLVISCVADYVSGDIKLQEGETVDAQWVTFEDAKSYPLIDGILDELAMAEVTRSWAKRRSKKSDWKRAGQE